MIETVRKLLHSGNSQDILLAMEFMFHKLTIKEIMNLVAKAPVDTPHHSEKGKAFRISSSNCVVYFSGMIWLSALNFEETRYHEFLDYLGEHPELKNKENV